MWSCWEEFEDRDMLGICVLVRRKKNGRGLGENRSWGQELVRGEVMLGRSELVGGYLGKD